MNHFESMALVSRRLKPLGVPYAFLGGITRSFAWRIRRSSTTPSTSRTIEIHLGIKTIELESIAVDVADQIELFRVP